MFIDNKELIDNWNNIEPVRHFLLLDQPPKKVQILKKEKPIK